MIRLGWRLAVAGGRGSILGMALTALAVGLGTAILLFALSFWPAVADRVDRGAWHDAVPTEGATAGTWFRMAKDLYAERSIWSARVAAAGDAAPVLPPGIPALPRDGEAYVSPALADLIASVPADQLGVRYGRVVGLIGDEALSGPDELVAIVGTTPERLRGDAGIVTAFPAHGEPPPIPPLAILLVGFTAAGALAPVAVFVASATRLSAARREQRLAALRLVGATPGQTAFLAVVEAFAAAGAGAVVGVVLFFLLRPLVAHIPLGSVTWFPDAITPPLLPAAALLAVVPVVGVAAALVALRRVAVTPLGVQRRVAVGRPRLVRLAPLAASVAVLLITLPSLQGSGASDLGTIVVMAAFVGIIAGIAVAGPLLTALAGSALGRVPAGGSTLLAARRLADDPRGSFGSIAGVVMAVFVATTFLTFADLATREAGATVDLHGQPGSVIAFLNGGAATRSAALEARLGTVTGVEAVVPVRRATLSQGESAGPEAWIVDCRTLVRVLATGDASCGRGPVLVPPGTTLDGAWRLVGDAPAAAADAPVAPLPATLGRETAAPGIAAAAEGAVLVDPAAVANLDAFPVARLYVRTDAAPGSDERVRSALLAVEPTAAVAVSTDRFVANPIYTEIGRIVVLGLLMTMALAGCSLAVAVTTSVADRRRQFVFLRSAGMPASGLRAVVLLQAGVPLAAVAAFSGLLGVVVAEAILLVLGISDPPLPALAIGGLLLASVAVAMGVVVLTLPSLERMTRPATLRVE